MLREPLEPTKRDTPDRGLKIHPENFSGLFNKMTGSKTINEI